MEKPGYRWCAPESFGRGSQAGVGLVEVVGWEGVGEARLRAAGLVVPGVGGLVVGKVFDVDFGVVSRSEPWRLRVFVHASSYVAEEVSSRLEALGFVETVGVDGSDWRGVSFDLLLDRALVGVPSVLGLRQLEMQRDRWELAGLLDDSGCVLGEPSDADVAHARLLGGLLRRGVVVAVGAANAGKSTLLNAVAKRSVSVVSSEAGTTRDHVGVEVSLGGGEGLASGGVRVRWVDTPGLGGGARDAAIDAASVAAAKPLVASADVVVVCAASDGEGADWDELGEVLGIDGGDARVVRCVTKSDVVGRPGWAETGWVLTSAEAGDGLAELVSSIRRALVPDEAVVAARPWWFFLGDAV